MPPTFYIIIPFYIYDSLDELIYHCYGNPAILHQSLPNIGEDVLKNRTVHFGDRYPFPLPPAPPITRSPENKPTTEKPLKVPRI